MESENLQEFVSNETVLENKSTKQEKYVLGKNPDGTYLTPYQTTIFYKSDPFESAVSHLSAKSQPIPVLGEIDANTSKLWAAAPQYITPDILLFDKLANYDAFFSRGFQRVLIFVGDCANCGCGDCGDDGEISNCDEHRSIVENNDNSNENAVSKNANENAVSESAVSESAVSKNANENAVSESAVSESAVSKNTKAHNKIIYFHLKNFYKYVMVEPGITPAYLMEYFLAFRFPSYKSQLDTINNATARHLYRGMLSEGFAKDSAFQLEDVIGEMTRTYKGFDKIAEYIAHGQAITNERLRLAESRLRSAERKEHNKLKYARIYNGDLAGELQSIYVCEATRDLDFIILDDFVNRRIVDLRNKLSNEEKTEFKNL